MLGSSCPTSVRDRSVALACSWASCLFQRSAAAACSLVTVAVSVVASARSLSSGPTSRMLLPNRSCTRRALFASSSYLARASATSLTARAGSISRSLSACRPMAARALAVSLSGLVSARPLLSLTMASPTVSSVWPVRRATSSSALMFSMLAPVMSFRSFRASMPSTVARSQFCRPVTAKAPPRAPPMAPAAVRAVSKLLAVRSAETCTRRSARVMPSCRVASLATRSMDRVARAIGGRSGLGAQVSGVSAAAGGPGSAWSGLCCLMTCRRAIRASGSCTPSSSQTRGRPAQSHPPMPVASRFQARRACRSSGVGWGAAGSVSSSPSYWTPPAWASSRAASFFQQRCGRSGAGQWPGPGRRPPCVTRPGCRPAPRRPARAQRWPGCRCPAWGRAGALQ